MRKGKKKKGLTTLYPRGFSYNVSGIESEINIWSSEVTWTTSKFSLDIYTGEKIS